MMGHYVYEDEDGEPALDEMGMPTKGAKVPMCSCGKKGWDIVEERYSLGIYAGLYCDACWKESGYRDEGPEGFDSTYAGESYYEEDY